MITIACSKKEYKAKIGDYGIFTVFPFGAGDTIEWEEMSAEFETDRKALKEFQGKEDLTDEESKAIDEILSRSHERKKKMYNILRSKFTADDESKVDKMFYETELAELHRVHSEVIANG